MRLLNRATLRAALALALSACAGTGPAPAAPAPVIDVAPPPSPSAQEPGAPVLEPTVDESPKPPPTAAAEPTDDLLANVYRNRLAAVFTRGFTVQGLGLPPEKIAQLETDATCEISAKGTVLACTVKPSGNAEFDAAVASTLAARKGLDVPPPPEDRPDLLPRRLSIRFRCGPTCQ